MSGQKTLYSLVAVAAGFAAVWTFGPSATAQPVEGAGGGGFFGGGGLGRDVFGGPQSIAGEAMIQSGGTDGDPMQAILVSPDGSRVWGYSTARGEWKDSGLRGGDGAAVSPVVGASAAVFSTREKAYGFSSETGEWDTVDLPEGAEAQPAVGQDYAEVRTATAVSIFSARTGKWATVKFAEE